MRCRRGHWTRQAVAAGGAKRTLRCGGSAAGSFLALTAVIALSAAPLLAASTSARACARDTAGQDSCIRISSQHLIAIPPSLHLHLSHLHRTAPHVHSLDFTAHHHNCHADHTLIMLHAHLSLMGTLSQLNNLSQLNRSPEAPGAVHMA